MSKRKGQAEIGAKTYMDDKVLIRLHPDLKRLLDEEADRKEIYGGMGELAAIIIAQYFKWNVEQAQVPRKRAGRRSTARSIAEQVSG